MYVKSRRVRGVKAGYLLRMVTYLYLIPGAGYYQKLRNRFGVRAKLILNSDLALHLVLKNFPSRQPGMEVLIDAMHYKRFRKVVDKFGLKAIEYSGERDLLDKAQSKQVALVMVPDRYSAMHRRYKKQFAELSAVKLVYQNRKHPRHVDLQYDIYMWEPSQLPRSVSGSVLVVESDRLERLHMKISENNASLPRLANSLLLRDMVRALRGYENKYRRIDSRPPKVLARILYDFYI